MATLLLKHGAHPDVCIHELAASDFSFNNPWLIGFSFIPLGLPRPPYCKQRGNGQDSHRIWC